MKKLITAFILFLVVSLCYADDYQSNLLFQKLGPVVDMSHYVLREDGDSSNLYFNNRLIRRKTISVKTLLKGYESVVVMEDYDNNFIETYKYVDDLLSYYSYESDSKKIVINYNYSDNVLFYTSTKVNDENPVLEYYLRDIYGKFIGTKRYDRYSFSGTSYLIDDDSSVYTEINSLVLKDDFTVNEDLSVTYVKGDVTYTYSPTGLLLSEESDSCTTEYNYSEDLKVSASKSVYSDKYVVSEYDEFENVLKSYTYDLSDLLMETIEYKKDGNVKTLYSNGFPIAEILYDKNNIKALDIRYFK